MCLWCRIGLLDGSAHTAPGGNDRSRLGPEARGEGPDATGHSGTIRAGGDQQPVTAASVDVYGHQTPGLPAVPRNILSPIGRSVGSTYGREHPSGTHTFAHAPTNHYPEMDQAEAGTPRTSKMGQAMIRVEGSQGLTRGQAGLMSYALPLATYIHGAHRYDGFIGVNIFKSAQQRAYVGSKGYSGIAPQDTLQPKINKPWPFNRANGSSTGS